MFDFLDEEERREAEPLLGRCGNDLDQALDKIGLYHPKKELRLGAGEPVVAVEVIVGDVAFAGPRPSIEEQDAAEREAAVNRFLDRRAVFLEGDDGGQ